MLDFLKNDWIISIGGGIIVFFLTNGVSRWFLKKKDNSKYIEQINQANSDIIRTVKPYVAEKGLPDKEILDAIIVSTARKYKVKSDELYSSRIICEELIREIVESVYVSCDKKQEYAKQLGQYIQKMTVEKNKDNLLFDLEKDIKSIDSYRESHYRQKFAAIFSALISMIAAVLTTVVSFVAEQDLHDTQLQYMVLGAAIITIMAGICYYIITYKLKNKAKEK